MYMYNTLDVTLEASLKVNKHHGGRILKQSTAGYPSLTYTLAHTHTLWTYFELMQCFPLSSPSCQYSWLWRFSKLNLLINTVLATCVTSPARTKATHLHSLEEHRDPKVQ